MAGYPNVTVHAADGAAFGPGPCNAMMFINAGVTHPHLPWLERLADGGKRIVLPLTFAVSDTTTGGMGLMLKITHDGGRFAAQVVSQVGIYSRAPACAIRGWSRSLEKALAAKLS